MSCSSCLGTGAVCITRGDDATLTIDFPADYDLTGSTVLFTLKRAADTDMADNSAVVKATAEHVDANTVRVSITAEQTRTIPAGDYLWDLRVITADGESMHTRISSLCIHNAITNRSG